MKPYKTFSCHKTGTSHIAKGLECEDYSLCYEDEYISICAVSDGHGDKNCFRSAIGSKLACESAIRQIRQFFSYGEETKSALEKNSDITLNQLEKSIIVEWTNQVKYHFLQNPFLEAELSPLSEDIQKFYRENIRPQKAYGCTLIVSAITSYCWFSLQIGDGICTAIFDDGVYLNLMPSDDEGCVGNRSTSICSSDAIRSFRHYYGTVLPVAVFVTSDGMEESFDNKGLNKCYYTISCWVNAENSDSVNTHLENLLPQISSGGSGDDVSLSIIINPSYPAMPPKQTLEEVNHKIKLYTEHTEILRVKYNKAIEARNMILSENEAISNRIEQLQSEIEMMKRKSAENSEKLQQLSEIEKESEEAEEQLKKMINYKKSADIFWKNKNEILSLGIEESEFLSNI